MRIQLRTARLGLVDAEAAYRKAKLDLGSLMNLTREEIEALEIRGSISDTAPPPPGVEELRQDRPGSERPDMISYRLGVSRAEADVRLARANRFNDVFVSVPAVHLPGQHALRLEERRRPGRWASRPRCRSTIATRGRSSARC